MTHPLLPTAVASDGSTTDLDVDGLVASFQTADALPSTVSRLATLICDGDASINQIVEVLSLDQALTASLLRQANSAALGGTVGVRTVRDAAVRLGQRSVLDLALSASVSRWMRDALPAYGLSEGQLWRHSVAASMAADVIRSKAVVDVPAEAGTAALLHDFGKVVLARNVEPEVFDHIAAVREEQELDELEAELQVLGTDHAEVGARVAQAWRLPSTIVMAIEGHHSTSGTQWPVCLAVSLAFAMIDDVLADGEVGQDSTVPTTHRDVMRTLGLDPSKYAGLVLLSRRRFAQMAQRFDL